MSPPDALEPRDASAHDPDIEDSERWPVDIARLEERIAEAEARERKQLAWWIIGTTPAAILPIAAALSYGQELLAALFIVLALVIQTVRWFSARKGRREMERELAEARAALLAEEERNALPLPPHPDDVVNDS